MLKNTEPHETSRSVRLDRATSHMLVWPARVIVSVGLVFRSLAAVKFDLFFFLHAGKMAVFTRLKEALSRPAVHFDMLTR